MKFPHCYSARHAARFTPRLLLPPPSRRRYQLLERLGNARKALEQHLEAGNAFSAASETAMALGKGKLATKLSMLAEEVWGLCPEEEEETAEEKEAGDDA